jgi:hypothetical protein
LPELQVAEPDGAERVEPLVDAGYCFEGERGFIDRQLQRIRDGETSITDLEGLTIVTLAAASVAPHVYVGQKVHFHPQHSVALTRLAAPTFHVEREAAWFVASRARIWQRGEELAQVGEHARIRRRVRAWGATDRGLIDAHDLVDLL